MTTGSPSAFEDGGNGAAFVVESQLDIGRVDPVLCRRWRFRG